MFNAVSVQQMNSKKNNLSIIDMANAAYSITAPSTATTTTRTPSTQQQHSREDATSKKGRGFVKNQNIDNCNGKTVNSLDDRLDAARTMLGISPCSVTDDIMGGRGGRGELGKSTNNKLTLVQQEKKHQQASSSTMTTNDPKSSSRRPRSNSAGLDALAFLATREQEALPTASTIATVSILLKGSYELNSNGGRKEVHNNSQIIHNSQATTTVVFPNPVTSSSDDDSEIMPPPPPRTLLANYINNNGRMSRRRSVSNPEGMDKWGTKRLRLVLPACIIEEEIAEANAAIMVAKKEKSTAETVGESSSSSLFPDNNDERNNESLPTPVVDDEEEYLDHDQLLRRARSRLLEDLSQSSIVSGEKGVLTYPHSLKKYKEVYNKNGHIGIYTPAERAAIIARFQKKRKSRVWNKKIRYNCRKNLADRRLRIKGRFVKRSSPSSNSDERKYTVTDTKNTVIASEEGKITTSTETAETGKTTDFGTTSAIPSIPEDTEFIANDDNVTDTEMPDVTDPDAGFCPTDDQPYRRLRRHTIT